MEAFARRWATQLHSTLLWPFHHLLTTLLHHVSRLRDFTFSHFKRMLSINGTEMDAANGDKPPWRMQHLKTKEECRLKNDLVEIWTVEMPSKHAEGILK